jgi:hypothetical protein
MRQDRCVAVWICGTVLTGTGVLGELGLIIDSVYKQDLFC